MRYCVLIGLIALMLGNVGISEAQHKHKMDPYFKGRYKSIKVPRTKLKYICPGYTGGGYPYQALGVKLGDPIAITYKLYIIRRLAFVMDYGRTATGLYNQFHQDNFAEAMDPDTIGVGESVKYFGHTGKRDGIFEAKLLFNTPFKQIEGLHWYIGAGVQYRWNNIEYSYIQENMISTELKKYKLDNYTLGPSAIIGIEYGHPDVPISSFFEVESYFDTWNFPGWIRISAGVGLRYML